MAITTGQVKGSRERIDRFAKGLVKIQPSREVALSITNLQRTSMFMGLMLKDMDSPNPYPESHNKDSQVIEDRADQSSKDYNFDAQDHIGMVKEMRNDMESEIVEIKEMYRNAFDTAVKAEHKPFYFAHIITAITCFEESKMWLGMELERIKNSSIA